MSGSFPESSSKPLLNDRLYDSLKKLTTIVLPAVSTLYFALAQIWHFPKTEEVVGSFAAVNVFLGALLGFSTKSYNKSDAKYSGHIEIDPSNDDPNTRYLVNLNANQPLDHSKEVTFRVVNTYENM